MKDVETPYEYEDLIMVKYISTLYYYSHVHL